MSTFSYTLLKISLRVYKIHWLDLNHEQKSKVLDIYYNYC